MATLSHTVDPDLTADYASNSALEAAQQQDLTDGGGDEYIAVIISSSGTADTIACSVDGWTTGPENDITFIVSQANRHDGKWNTAKPRQYVEDGRAFNISEDYVNIIGCQCANHTPTANARNLIRYEGAGKIVVENCIIKGHDNDAYYVRGISIINIAAQLFVSNCVIYDMGQNVGSKGIHVQDGQQTSYVYDLTIVNCYTGVENDDTGTIICTNVLVDGSAAGQGFEQDVGTLIVNYSASSDDSADDWTGNNNRINQNFTFLGAEDFHLDPTDAGAKTFGTDLSGDGNYPISIDVDGNTRSGIFDIGAHNISTVVGTDYTRTISDSVGIMDILSRVGNFFRSITDILGITDNVVTGISPPAPTIERITASTKMTKRITGSSEL